MAALSALRTTLFLKLTDQNARVITAAQATSLLNEALEAWVDVTQEIYQETAFPSVASQFDYSAPSDILEIKGGWWGPTNYTEIIPSSYPEFEEAGGRQLNLRGGIPSHFALEGTNASNNATLLRFRFFPPPQSTSSSSTLGGNITAATTSISVADATKFRASGGWVQCGSELILYQLADTTNNLLTICRRGMGNTTAASHSSGATVTQCDFHVLYSRRAATLSSDTDVPEINPRFHKYLVEYALKEALALDGRMEQAELAEKKWNDALIRGRRAVRNIKAAQPSIQLSSPY